MKAIIYEKTGYVLDDGDPVFPIICCMTVLAKESVPRESWTDRILWLIVGAAGGAAAVTLIEKIL